VSAKLNLASQPFRNRALPWTITAIVTVASLIALVFITRASVRTNAQADAVERDVKSLNQQVALIQGQAAEIKEALTPEQEQALQAAHTLVDRKRFSWSRLFADLEAALPGGVRVTRITVRDVALRGGRTYAELELAVVGKNPTDVTQMIAEMDREGVFQAEPAGQNLLRGRGEGGTEWTLRVLYSPRQGAPAATSAGDSVATAHATNATAAAAVPNGRGRP